MLISNPQMGGGWFPSTQGAGGISTPLIPSVWMYTVTHRATATELPDAILFLP